jgi:HTH-type transcriptional regulator / antitoxin HigA
MNALTMNEPAEIFPPGEFLKDELEARNWSQTEFAEIIGRPVRLINEIIGGKKSITPETAVQLGASLGTSAELWMNLESQFQLSKVRKDNDAIQRKAKLYERFPVREMTRRGWVEKTEDIGVLEYQFTKFFDIKSVEEPIQLPHAAKKGCYDDVTMLQWAWLHRVKQIAQTFVLKKYTKEALVDALPKLHALMSAPEEIRKVSQILNEAGVRFVVVEALPGTKIDGACLWLSDTQPVIAVSARLDRIDNFWFVLRHEIEHLLQEHGKSNRLMFDEDISEGAEDGLIFEERVANNAAAEFCVSDKDLQNYMLRVNPFYFAEDRILGFSGRLGVHPGIVVGRLQKKLDKAGYPNPYKYLRSYLVKVREIVKQSSPSDGWGEIHPLA